ncbi:hypothetical protein BN132_1883 [Cronobacter turicensis 564]|nr:hypothetical protein BN132_1883 [Cronobacter turicensis 564]
MIARQQLQPEREGRQRVFIDISALIVGFLIGRLNDLSVRQELSALLSQVVSGWFRSRT